MTKDSNKDATPTPAPTPTAARTPKAAAAVPVVVAVHKVVYGPKQVAPPGSMFRPNDAEQLAHLRSIGAVRDTNEAEAALAKQLVPALVETESTIG